MRVATADLCAWRASQKCIGSLGKEDPLGAFASQWKAALKTEAGFTTAEVAPALATLLATKDSKEQASRSRTMRRTPMVLLRVALHLLLLRAPLFGARLALTRAARCAVSMRMVA
eukprot:937610-Pleurochrysis_carterae.AAC.1